MKNIFAALCLTLVAAMAHAGETSDGTVSVLKSPAVTTPCQASACQVEEVRALKLPEWQVRRLNRIADRQEVREARRCDCACGCSDEKNVLVESRRKKDCCCK
jgi:nucleotidyltransferase/DNA polymerase involved in DNA repair